MSKITAMYIRLSMEDEDVSLNRKEESNSMDMSKTQVISIRLL